MRKPASHKAARQAIAQAILKSHREGDFCRNDFVDTVFSTAVLQQALAFLVGMGLIDECTARSNGTRMFKFNPQKEDELRSFANPVVEPTD